MPMRARDLVALGMDGQPVRAAAALRGQRAKRSARCSRAVGRRALRRRPGRGTVRRRAAAGADRPRAHQPARLLLLDEPLANLDLRSGQEVVTLLARIAREQQIAVLLSAHEMNPLLPVMDRVVYLAAGRAASGPTGEVIRAEVLSRLYGHHVDVLHVARPDPGRRRREREPPHTRTAAARRQRPARRADGYARDASCTTSSSPGSSPAPGPHRGPRSAPSWPSSPAWSGCSPSCAASRSPATRSPTSARPAAPGRCSLGIGPFCRVRAAGIAGAARHGADRRQRPRGRDLATGIVLGAALGAAALFLYLGTHHGAPPGRRSRSCSARSSRSARDTVPALIASRRGRAGGRGRRCPAAAAGRGQPRHGRRPGRAGAHGGPRLPGGAGRRRGLSAVAIGAILSTALLIGPAADRAAADQDAPGRAWRPRPDRRGRHLARHPARLRQLLLGSGPPRLAGQLLHRRPRLPRLPAPGCPRRRRRGRPAARPRPGHAAEPPGGRQHVLRPHDEHLDRRHIVAVVAGVVGFFVVLRGSAFAAHAIPNGAFAGAAGAGLLGISTIFGLAVFALARRARDRRARPPRPARRRHRARLVMMLALGAAVPSLDHRVRSR